MKIQRVLTVSKRFVAIDSYTLNLDAITAKLNAEGWQIKQVVSTSFNHELPGAHKYPVLSVTLLIEKEE